ncbi:MAG: hypothetical protein ABFD89_10660 [Bryobacteraceae bacterium]
MDLLLENLRTIGTHHCDQTVGEEAAQEIERLRMIVERASRLEGLYHNTHLSPDGFRLSIEGLARDAKAALAHNA